MPAAIINVKMLTLAHSERHEFGANSDFMNFGSIPIANLSAFSIGT